VLALALPGVAQATASATVSIGTFTVEFFDLDPNDGIAPAWEFLSQNSYVYAGLQTQDGTFIGNSDWGPGFYAPLQTSATWALGSASASTGSTSTVSGSTLGPGGGQWGYFYASAESAYGGFTLSPWTGIRLRMLADVSASITSVTDSEWAYGVARLYLSIADPDGASQVHEGLRTASAGLSCDLNGCTPNNQSFSGMVTVTYANFSGELVSGYFSSQAYAYGYSASPIPEPGGAALLLTGLLGLGAWLQRRRR
jgi:hypothetical protein